jgi:hypothetical protein
MRPQISRRVGTVPVLQNWISKHMSTVAESATEIGRKRAL